MHRFLLRLAALVSVVLIPSIAFPQSSFTDPIYIKTPRQGTLLVSGNFGYDSQIDLAYWTPHPDLDLYVWYKNGDGDFTKSVIPVDDVATLKAMKVGDFNADGYDDIIAIETMTNDTKVLLFTSNGASFTQKTIATAPGLAESIQVVKFNDDEHLDLLMSFTNADLISYLGNGSGTFTAETVTGTTSLRSFRHVDLNNDDRLDFVGLNNTTLKIFLKSETGYTASEKILSDTPFDFEVADFDGDDFVDVAVSFFTNSSGRIDIYKNAGDATFPASQTLAAGQQPYLFAQADYDNDGRQDLAASSFNSPSVLIFNNTPGGFMSYGPTQTKGNASTGIIFADTNDDNIRELVELRQQEINIYTRSNSGVFVLDETIILALFPNSGEVVDINDDQFNDIVAPSSKGIGVMYGQPNFSFSEPVYTQTVGDLQPAISIADFNNDNLKDVIYTGYAETGIMLSDLNALKEPQVLFSGNMSQLVSADFNNDGNMDFAGQGYVMLGDGTGNFTQEYTEMGDVFSIGVGFFNDDELPDLVVTAPDGIAYIGLNSGTAPLFSLFDVVPDVTGQPLMITTKFNDDNFTDIVVGANFENKFSILVNNGDGTFTRKDVTLGENNGAFAALPSFSDFNNDGRIDAAIPYSNIPDNGGMAIFLQDENGNLVIADKIDFAPKQAPGYATLGDVNEDQKLDIVTFDLNSNNAITIVPSLYQPLKSLEDIGVSDRTRTTANISVNAGSGSGRIFFIRLASESNAEPVDGTLYSADAKFGSGTGPSSTIFALAKGDINNVTVTNLTRGTTYVATAYEYNENIAGTKTDYNPTGAQVQFTTLKDQAITVTNPGAKAMGETPFAITASSTSGLPIAFTAVTANVVIDAGKVVLRAPGPAKVKSSQPGNEDYSPAEDVEITFCVNPPQPAIVIQKPDGKYLLTSSSETNNQWLLNGTEIAGATGNTLEPPVDGVYSVKVDFSGCSATSVPTSNLITGIEDVDQNVVVHPNPAKEVVIIQTGPFAIKSTDVLFTDATGRQHFFNGRQEGNNRLAVNVASTLIRGLYVIEVQTNIGAVRKKIMID